MVHKSVIIAAVIIYLPVVIAMLIPLFTKLRGAAKPTYAANLIINSAWFTLVYILVEEGQKTFENVVTAFGFAIVSSVGITLAHTRMCVPRTQHERVSQVDISVAHQRFHLTNQNKLSSCCKCCRFDDKGNRDREFREYEKQKCSLEVLDEIDSPAVSLEELQSAICENLSLPPTLGVKVVSYDIVKEEHGSDFVLRKELSEPISYGSWENRSQIPPIPKKSIIFYKSKPEIIISPTLKEQIRGMEDEMIGQVFDTAAYTTIIPDNKVPGYIPYAIAHLNSSAIEWFRSDIGLLVYRVTIFIGVSSLFEIVWRSRGVLLEHNSVKYVTNDNSLPVPVGMRDTSVYNGVL